MLSPAEESQSGVHFKAGRDDLVQPERIRETDKATGCYRSKERGLVFWRAGRRTKRLPRFPGSAEFYAAGSERQAAFSIRLSRQESSAGHLGFLVRLPVRPARLADSLSGTEDKEF